MRIGRIILFAALAALLLLGGRTLVEGPEAAAQTASLPLPPLHAVLEAADAPVNAAAAETPLQAERIRRRRFYMANGMQPAQVMASVFGVNMELLCWNCRVDFCSYHAFYRDNYSAWAAQHIVEAEYPPQAQLP